MTSRSRFEFDLPNDGESPEGGIVKNWAPQFECWAVVEIAGGGALAADGGIVASLTARIALRIAPETLTITDDWRARDISLGQPGVAWNVLAIEPPAPGAGYIWLRIGKGKAAA